ncbi:MAG: hypothetical protein CME24_00285 [Gemmatimonadetes bacterium]|nr:hypothetical protein [Gemmatimonadota bacterium]
MHPPQTDSVPIRAALPSEVARLSALAISSKAVWGYDDTFMAACRDELTVSRADLELAAFVAESEDRSAHRCGTRCV